MFYFGCDAEIMTMMLAMMMMMIMIDDGFDNDNSYNHSLIALMVVGMINIIYYTS